ncbi:hypothetical protein BBJ28_00012983 [Nothophytophthora sp. Chile5]|nr:hypothetical protein BBJ28_00012983 [Nothophytophthora sp. Chile5]
MSGRGWTTSPNASNAPSEPDEHRWMAESRRLASSKNPSSSFHRSTGFASSRSGRSERSGASDEPHVELPPGRRREIMARVHDSVQNVMASMLSDRASNVHWRPKLRKKNISYYVDDTSVKPGQTRFCCVSHTSASVADVMELFLMTDTESLLKNNRVLYNNLLEARVLTVLRRPTKERPMNSMYVRYSCFQTPGPMVNRDMCVAVATDMIRQPDGSTIGYCLWDSVDDPAFTEAAQTPGLQPVTMFRSGFFLRSSGREQAYDDEPTHGQTKIVYMVGMEPGGWAPGLTTRLLMEKFGANLGRLCSHFRRKHLDSSTFVMKAQWVSKGSARSCRRCLKSFQVLSKRVNCHSCGQVVCRSCTSKETVELHAVGLVPMRICLSCLENAGLFNAASPPTTATGNRRNRLGTESLSESTTQSQSVVEVEQEDDGDTDTDADEWAFTPSGVPVRPYRIAT